MADEKPKNARKTPARAPRKRGSGQSTAETASAEGRSSPGEALNSETPVLGIEQSSEVASPVWDDYDEIRRQAYALYLSRGGADGGDLSDWLEAERIVRLRRGSGAERTEAAERDQR